MPDSLSNYQFIGESTLAAALILSAVTWGLSKKAIRVQEVFCLFAMPMVLVILAWIAWTRDNWSSGSVAITSVFNVHAFILLLFLSPQRDQKPR